MTVAELIALLARVPDDAQVDYDGWGIISGIVYDPQTDTVSIVERHDPDPSFSHQTLISQE